VHFRLPRPGHAGDRVRRHRDRGALRPVMRDLLIPVEVVVAVLVLTALLLFGVVSRRRFLTRDVGAFDCSLRVGSSPAAKGWRLGVARYESDRIDWYRVFSVSPRPAES